MGAIIAAGAARAQADLLERFRVGDATAPDRAQTLEKLGLEGSMYFDRLEAQGVICRSPDSPSRYYLDERAMAAYGRRATGRVKLVALGGAFLLIAIGVAMMWLTSRPH
jgi:hypothetical protein